MTSIDKKIQDFSKKYEAQISDSDRKFRRSVATRWFSENYEDQILATPKVEEVLLIRVDLPTDKFRTLVQLEDKLEQWDRDSRIAGSKGIDAVEYLFSKEYQEISLRERYPAVQKAYDQYMLMLTLAKSGEL